MKNIFILLVIIIFSSCKTQNLKVIENSKEYILIDGGSFFKRQGVILMDTLDDDVGISRYTCYLIKNYNPTFFEIQNIEKKLKQTYKNKYNKYYRQYYGYITKEYDTLIEIRMITKHERKNKYWNWKKETLIINEHRPFVKIKKNKNCFKKMLIFNKNKNTFANVDSIYKKIYATFYDSRYSMGMPPPRCFKKKINR